MRVFRYLMVDLLKAKKKSGAILVLLLFMAIYISAGSSASVMFSLIYCTFCGTILAGIPYQYEQVEENGFLNLLPGKTAELVCGHFLYGMLSVLLGFLIGLISRLIGQQIHPGESYNIEMEIENLSTASEILHLSLLIIGAALIIVAVQNLLCILFHFESVQVMNVLRILPGFVFFFGAMALMSMGLVGNVLDVGKFLFRNAIPVFLGCMCIFWGLAYIGVLVSKSRE